MTKTKLLLFVILNIVLLTSCSNNDEEEYVYTDDDKIALGNLIFNDTNLSNPVGQSCATCHAPETGFSDSQHRMVSEGAVKNAFGNRNSPAIAYNAFAPSRYFDTVNNTYVGGFFLDGRSPNLQDQAIHPMLNPVEMNNASNAEIVAKIKEASYYPKMIAMYGNSTSEDDIISYIEDALMKFETSSQVNPFTSKYDYYLEGKVTLSAEEQKGLELYEGKAKCAVCHITEPDPIINKVLLTNFIYDNIGVPKNPNNPFYSQPSNELGTNFIDLGIGAIVNQPAQNGKFKVPSLRNVAVSAPYFHNGSIETLEKVVRFYNKRDFFTGEFGPSEVYENMNTKDMGHLDLTNAEEQNLVAFLKTLTDGYQQ